MRDAMRDDVGEMIVKCGVNVVGVAVCQVGVSLSFGAGIKR